MTMQTDRRPLSLSIDFREYAALIAIFAIETVIFFLLMETRFAPFYPPNSDQTSYFMDTYELIERTKVGGIGVLFNEITSSGHAAGVLFTIQGAIMGLIFGSSRTIIASINLVYFIALQATLFFTIRRKTNEPAIAWIGAAFLLMCGTTFLQPGGIFDYRIDFSALCLYGIWCCLIIDSRCLLTTKRWVIVIGIALILLRFFTVAYIGAVLGGLLIYTSAHWWKSTAGPQRMIAARRAKNIFVAGLSIAILTLPVLFFARTAIYNYYVVGHFLSDEKYIRAAEMGITGHWSNLIFYPRQIELSHLSHAAMWLILIVCVATLVFGVFREKALLRKAAGRICDLHNEFVALGLCIVFPLIALTLNVAKSPIVGGIVLVPILLVVLLLLWAIWPTAWQSSSDGGEDAIKPVSRFKWLGSSTTVARVNGNWVAALAFAIAAIVFLGRAGHTKVEFPRRDLEQITAMNEKIAAYLVNNGMSDPKISFDRPVDYLNQGTVRLFEYEKEGRLLALEPRFGHGGYGIFATPRDVAMRLWADSDVNVLTDPISRRSTTYPISTKIREYWDEMRAWTVDNRVLVYSTEIMGVPHKMYAMAPVGIAGIEADNWVTSRGITLAVSPDDLVRWPYILLTGTANYTALKGVPQATAVSRNADGSRNELPVKFDRKGESYSILIDGRTAKGLSDKVEIHLIFDRYFEPGATDTRKLVIFAPRHRRMVASPP